MNLTSKRMVPKKITKFQKKQQQVQQVPDLSEDVGCIAFKTQSIHILQNGAEKMRLHKFLSFGWGFCAGSTGNSKQPRQTTRDLKDQQEIQ